MKAIAITASSTAFRDPLTLNTGLHDLVQSEMGLKTPGLNSNHPPVMSKIMPAAIPITPATSIKIIIKW